MKKLVLLVISILLVSGITYAQERGGGDRPSKTAPQGGPRGDRPNFNPEEIAKRQTQRLVDELKLNKEQEAKAIAINKKYTEKQTGSFGKMRDASDADRAKMREEMDKLQAERNKEIRAILTPEQAKTFDEIQKKREEMRRNGGGPGGFGGGPR